MFYDFKEIRDRAQAARRRELEKLYRTAALALARGISRLVRLPPDLAWRLDPEDRPGY